MRFRFRFRRTVNVDINLDIVRQVDFNSFCIFVGIDKVFEMVWFQGVDGHLVNVEVENKYSCHVWKSGEQMMKGVSISLITTCSVI